MKRFDCLKVLNTELDPHTITVTNFRGNAIEWSYLRGNKLNLYGFNMGLCTGVAVGIAAAVPDHNVIVMDSDGSFMLDGTILITLARLGLKNLCIIVFDNEAYGEYSASPTADGISLEKLAQSVGIRARTISDLDSFKEAIQDSLKFETCTFIDVKIKNHTEKFDSPYRYNTGRRIREEFEDSMREELGQRFSVSRKNAKSGEKHSPIPKPINGLNDN